MRRGESVPPIEEVAAVTQRLAVLLSAGVSPVSAWEYLLPPRGASTEQPVTRGVGRQIDSPGAGDAEIANTGILRAAARAAACGDSVADAIVGQARGETESAWRGLAAAWQVATQAGAPLAGCLRELAASLRDLAQVQRDLEVALAAPRATARLVMVLPVIGILFGSLMGFDSVHTLFATVPGLLCLAGGGVLMLAAAGWSRALVRRAAPTELTPGLRLELMAIAMSGGGSIDRSRALVHAAAARYAIGSGTESRDDPIERVLDLSTRAGVPAAELLRSEAEQTRRDARSAGQRRAETLSVTLMLPLGLCVLPAFMLVGVVPLLISVLSSTLATF
ncbi:MULTISPECIES: type II secretion system F family protein [unclassified Cryobacterium]|uniref:type II secretion system F family protein n=1 Tax=unclassified Cryobacterium TaxID=2649013 RepID=UPI000CE33EB1|nr:MULTISPECIES: type II secretion system F family protein [unclassified Cryobacterium]